MSQDKTDKELIKFWEDAAKDARSSSDYYQEELEKAHALLGRVIHQLSERWDTVNVTKYFPTNNLHRNKNINNPSGDKK